MARVPRDPITERDLRRPEFMDCDIQDLERRADGTIARRDRWERGMRTIASLVGIDARQTFEVVDIVERVRELVALTVPTAHAPVDGPAREDH